MKFLFKDLFFFLCFCLCLCFLSLFLGLHMAYNRSTLHVLVLKNPNVPMHIQDYSVSCLPCETGEKRGGEGGNGEKY